MMRTSLLAFAAAAFLGLTPGEAAAQNWNIDLSHSSVTWGVDHLVISETTGTFNDFAGTITNFDGKDASKAAVNVTFQVASIDSGSKDRDDHLRSPDFFDVAQFPTATFVSKSITPAGNGMFNVVGDFTLHGVTKEITVPMKFRGTTTDPWGNTRAGFQGTITINRQDFGVSWNKTLDAGGVAVGDDVRIDVRVEAVMEKPAPAPEPAPAETTKKKKK